MIVDIYNEVFTKVKTKISPIRIETSYPETTPIFPCVIMEEMGNTTLEETVDTAGEKHNVLGFEINIFTVTSEKATIARAIRNDIDSIMGDFYGMSRDYSGSMPSYLNNNIYRLTLRYSCVVDKDKKLYRR